MITLYGLDPIEEECQRLDLTIWAWHALWTYLEEMHPDFACIIPISNSDDDVAAEDCEVLAMRLDRDIGSGAAGRYVDERQLILRAMPGVKCHVCGGRGTRTDVVGDDLGMVDKELHPEMAVRVGRSHGWCNLCRGHGTLFDFEKAHDLSVSDIQTLIEFLECAGGLSVHEHYG